METNELKELFERYIAGRATEDEVNALLQHFHVERDSEALLELIVNEMADTTGIDEATLAERQPVYSRVYNRLQYLIDADERVIVPMWRQTWFRAVAVVIVFVVAGILLVLRNNAQPDMIAVNVPMGHTLQVTLPDSSKIWLNAGSCLQYPERFIGKTRTVYLKGQAFFDVVHQAEHPFLIRTSTVAVTVLGTSFEIKAFAQEKDTRITVATGKVGLTITALNKGAVFLLPGQQVIVDNNTKSVVQHQGINDIAAWRENRLVFDNESLDNVFQALERKYNVHIKVQSPKLLTEITSMKLNNQPLSDVLTALSFSKHFQYQLANDSTVIIK
ncbi:FecR family protein [Mucilaginibacter gracilis]|uniref:FecR family protein n=1 Tax=Mucilaginibacter gracilis TaxID=423350 RepID=A0A495IXC9_9SPHI|nr:FecR family protein [Mucilaginibacter gracilis]RKR80704.1 FecR family protein [Mucilaginibacter gracilis]